MSVLANRSTKNFAQMYTKHERTNEIVILIYDKLLRFSSVKKRMKTCKFLFFNFNKNNFQFIINKLKLSYTQINKVLTN